jgi:type I restriction enzyme R subunit
MYLDKPMRDHVLLQAIARVNRPYSDGEQRKRVGLVVDFVGVLRDLKKALHFDSQDISGVIEDLDGLLHDFQAKMQKAMTDYLEDDQGGAPDERLERIVYKQLLPTEVRKVFYETYKDIEVLWEILSPSPELRDYIDDYKKLSALYATVRNAYRTGDAIFAADLAHKTKRLIQESAEQQGLGRLTKSVTFDVETLEALRKEKGSDEGKVFNLVRGLQQEIDDNAQAAAVLQSLKEKAERILKDLEDRKTTGLAAMDLLAALAAEKEEAQKAAKASGLSPRAFAVSWELRADKALAGANLTSLELAKAVDELLKAFPNLDVNPDEKRTFRSRLYIPLIKLPKEDRARVVDAVMNLVASEPDE